MLEYLFKSFEQVTGFGQVKKVIVCDGTRRRKNDSKKKSYRGGWVDVEGEAAYTVYKTRLRKLCESVWENTVVLELESRHGFGFAVKRSMAEIDTEFVIVIQHDRFFMRPLKLESVMQLLVKNDQVNCIYLGTNSTSDYRNRILSRFQIDLWEHQIADEKFVLLPMIIWLDSTHIARTEWYREFIFDRNGRHVAPGGFIEDKLGQVQLKRFMEDGFVSHKEFGTFMLPEINHVVPLGSFKFARDLIELKVILPVEEKVPWVRHVNGRSFLEAEQKEERFVNSG